jgi:(4S)-4-hydroxy-5-phosphonooxypentane-2,3-dione isomerase
MSKLAIIVEFEIVDGRENEFVAVLLEHAERSRNEEAGCIRIEVIRPVDENLVELPNRIAVNELYLDRGAFEEHRRSPRSALFGSAIAPLVASRRVIRATLD